VLVGAQSAVPRLRYADGLVIEDGENGVQYRLARPSDEFLSFLALSLRSTASSRQLSIFNVEMMRVRIAEWQHRQPDEEFSTSVYDMIRRISGRLLTLRISSTKKGLRPAEFARFANSFLFQVSYNLDAPLTLQRYLDEIVRGSRIASMRRSSTAELEAPKRFYVEDLIYHYQMGVSSDSPLLEYLSYYHVAEHFFEAVFEDDLIEQVRATLTQPDFSSKRKRDLQDLIRAITRSIKLRDEEVVFSELQALELTLARYVDTLRLRTNLDAFDPTLVAYYKTHPVEFSDGDTVDLTDSDQASVRQLLAKRIYKTRNAIVHSKEGRRSASLPLSMTTSW
jgi:hypothetical protein